MSVLVDFLNENTTVMSRFPGSISRGISKFQADVVVAMEGELGEDHDFVVLQFSLSETDDQSLEAKLGLVFDHGDDSPVDAIAMPFDTAGNMLGNLMRDLDVTKVDYDEYEIRSSAHLLRMVEALKSRFAGVIRFSEPAKPQVH